MIDYTTTIGSTADPLSFALSDDNGPIGLPEATALELRLRKRDLVHVVDLFDSITNAAEGRGVYTWSSATFPPSPGIYEAQYVITFADGTVAFVPNTRVGGQRYYRYEFLAAIPAPSDP